MGARGRVYRGGGRSVNGRDSKNIWPLEPYFFSKMEGGGGGGKPSPGPTPGPPLIRHCL